MKVERFLYLCCQQQSLVMKKQGQSCHYEGKSKREIEMKSVDMCNSKKKFAMEKRRRHVNNHKGVKRPK
jgi:hypothetical protein